MRQFRVTAHAPEKPAPDLTGRIPVFRQDHVQNKDAAPGLIFALSVRDISLSFERARQMANDTIAAVIPLHNKQRFISRAIGSVLAQTRSVDEIIVVDDASTDGSLSKLQAFADPRLRVLRRPVPGPGGYAARNLAIRAASSRWIAFLDADDSWQDDFIAEIRSLIAQAPETTGCLFTGYEKVWSGNRVVRDRYSLRSSGPGVRPWTLRPSWPPGSSSACRRSGPPPAPFAATC